MIKGLAIKERDNITRPEVNYRALSALNCSMIKLFDNDPVKFFEQFKLGKKKKDSKTTSLIIGDIVDFYLLDCKGNAQEFEDRFEEKFALFEETKATGQVVILAETLFDIAQANTNDEGEITAEFDTMFTEACNKVQSMGKYSKKTEAKILEDFVENGQTYYEMLISNVGKTVVEVSLLDKARKVAEQLMEDPFTEGIFTDDGEIEYFPKFAIEWKYLCKDGREIECKSEVDIMKIDHNKKIIYPKDLKTTYDNENFEMAYVKYRYDLQAAFYFLAIKYWAEQEGIADYSVLPMEFVVGDTSANNRRPIVYRLSISDLQRALTGYSINKNFHKGINQLIEEINWAEATDNWNVSKDVFDNKGIMKLNINYDESRSSS